MNLQYAYINDIYRLSYTVLSDAAIMNNNYMADFIKHFNFYVQLHASSEGFTRAIEAVGVYYYLVIEKLLEEKIVAGAEHLENAIGSLENILRDTTLRLNAHFFAINYNLCLLEENELKIIECLEALLEQSNTDMLEN